MMTMTIMMIMMAMMAMMNISIIHNDDDEIVTIGRAIRPSRSHVGKTGLE